MQLSIEIKYWLPSSTVRLFNSKHWLKARPAIFCRLAGNMILLIEVTAKEWEPREISVLGNSTTRRLH